MGIFKIGQHYSSIALAATMFSNVVPLLLYMLGLWGIQSLLWLYWVECVGLLGLAIFFLLYGIQIRQSERFLKTSFTVIFLLIGISWLIFLLWLIGFPSLKSAYPTYVFAPLNQLWANVLQALTALIFGLGAHLFHEISFLLGISLLIGNYIHLIYTHRQGMISAIDQMNLTTRAFSATITIILLATLEAWLVFDPKNLEARNIAFYSAVSVLVFKILYEIRFIFKYK